MVEAAPSDTYWGIGLEINSLKVKDVRQWQGHNVLGRILTELREKLSKKYAGELKLVESRIRRSIEMNQVVRAKIVLVGEEWLKNFANWKKPNYFVSVSEDNILPLQNLFVSSKCDMIIVGFAHLNPLVNEEWRQEFKRLGRNCVFLSKTEQPKNWPSNMKWVKVGSEECKEAIRVWCQE